MTKEINLNHICKIEGHADLSLKIEKNKVTQCELKANEGARFFEALVINKNINDIQEIVSRICGICSCAHSIAAIQALEEALSIKPNNTQKTIRELLMLGERIRSHATHLYFLALPDYFNVSSALALGNENKDKINDALRLISIGNKLVELFGAREMHPFVKIIQPYEKKDFSSIIKELKDSKTVIKRTIELFSKLNYPNLIRDTEYLSLKEESEYSIISGKVTSLNSNFIDDDYKKHLTENIKEYATSKFVLKNNNPFILGAISRINNNFKNLDKESRSTLENVLRKNKLALPLNNPFYNNICQSIELLQAVNRSIDLLTNFPENNNQKQIKIRSGKGVSAVEAPRGTLYHEYNIDENGKITLCNIITPTCQNLNMIEKDITQLVNELLEKNSTKEEIVNQIEKLIRSYDPCFSCSTHFLKVNWL